MTTITCIDALPFSPYNGCGKAGIIITAGCPTYFRIVGAGLDGITHFDWYPKNLGTVEFKTRQLILVNDTLGTCMVMVTDNFYSTTNRAGHLSFRLIDGNVLTYPVITYGQLGQLWRSPSQGLITG